MELKEQLELTKLIEENAAVIIYFYNDNCPPCISLRPKVEDLVKNEFPELKLAFVNGLENPEIPASYGVFSNPTLIIYFEGKEYRRESKYISINQLYETIDRPYGMLFCKK